MKRANGTGSVYKLSGKRRRPWMAVRAAEYEDGSAKRQIVGYFATKHEAEDAISLDRIRPVSAYANATLKGLWDMWIESKAFTRLSLSGQRYYRAGFAHLSPLHKRKYADLRRDHFQQCIDDAEEAGLSWSSLSAIRCVCSLLGEYASANDVVPKSYATKLLLPPKGKRKILTFTDDEIKLLSDHDAEPWVDTVLILIYTGMRISEMLKLKKEDVDINEMVIVGGVKTDAGKDRTIPVHPKIQGYILARHEASKKWLIERDGKALRDDAYRSDYYYPTLEALGIRRLTPHKARHTFFTRFDAVCNDKWAMAQIGGHTDPTFSQKTYSHPDIKRLRTAIEMME